MTVRRDVVKIRCERSVLAQGLEGSLWATTNTGDLVTLSKVN